MKNNEIEKSATCLKSVQFDPDLIEETVRNLKEKGIRIFCRTVTETKEKIELKEKITIENVEKVVISARQWEIILPADEFIDKNMRISIKIPSIGCYSVNINSEEYYLIAVEVPDLNNMIPTKYHKCLLYQPKDLRGIEKLLDLSEIMIDCYASEAINNIELIEEIQNLKIISIRWCESLKTLDSLCKLTNLTRLSISNCTSLANIGGLANLQGLTEIIFYQCYSILSVAALSNLNSLTSLNLNGCKSIKSVNSLKNLKNLTMLNLRDCSSLQNIDGIKNMSKLNYLNLRFCSSLKNIDSLSNLKDLLYLFLDHCEILENVDAISGLTNLKELYLSGCDSLQNIDGLSNMSNLSILDLGRCESLSNVNGLKNLTALIRLNMNSCESLQNIGDLSNLTNLIKLDVSYCKSIEKIGFSKKMSSLKELNMGYCELLKNIECLSILSNLKELDLSGCKSLIFLKPLAKLEKLEKVNMISCISVRDIDSLSSCVSLRELKCDHDPYSAESVLIATATLRKDIGYIREKKDDWINMIVLSPELETMAARLSKAFSLSTGDKWAEEGFEKLVKILTGREDCSENLMRKVLSESLKFGYPAYVKIFQTAVADNDRFAKPVIALLCDISDEAKKWAVNFVEDLLKPLDGFIEKERAVGPSVCFFYAEMGLDDKVRLWLNKVNDPEAPVWKDRIFSSIMQFQIKKGNINNAKSLLSEISTTIEKDKALSIFTQELSSSFPIEAGEAFDGIVDTVTRFVLAEKLRNVSEFTASLQNVYRLFLELESDPAKLSELVNQLLEQHPDSEVVKMLILQFKPDICVSEDTTAIIEDFLNSDLITNNTKATKLLEYKNRITNESYDFSNICRKGILLELEEEGLIDKEELKQMIETLREVTNESK